MTSPTKPAPEVEPEPRIRPFAEFLQQTNGGRTHNKVSEELHELIEEVLRTGKGGSVTLTVKVEPDDAEARRLVISETSSSKLPVAAPKKSIFWADENGNLQRTDPTQMSFGDLRSAGERNAR